METHGEATIMETDIKNNIDRKWLPRLEAKCPNCGFTFHAVVELSLIDKGRQPRIPDDIKFELIGRIKQKKKELQALGLAP